nr:hypothetical protein [Tanacetum cinerariifolium]
KFATDPWRNDYMDTLEINAPYILSLTINSCLYLEKLLLLNVSSLVKADLDYSNVGWSAIKSSYREDIVEEEMLKGLLQSLGHVNEITLGDYCFKVLSRLEATGFQFRKGSDVTSRGRRKRLFLINS